MSPHFDPPYNPEAAFASTQKNEEFDLKHPHASETCEA